MRIAPEDDTAPVAPGTRGSGRGRALRQWRRYQPCRNRHFKLGEIIHAGNPGAGFQPPENPVVRIGIIRLPAIGGNLKKDGNTGAARVIGQQFLDHGFFVFPENHLLGRRIFARAGRDAVYAAEFEVKAIFGPDLDGSLYRAIQLPTQDAGQGKHLEDGFTEFFPANDLPRGPEQKHDAHRRKKQGEQCLVISLLQFRGMTAGADGQGNQFQNRAKMHAVTMAALVEERMHPPAHWSFHSHGSCGCAALMASVRFFALEA